MWSHVFLEHSVFKPTTDRHEASRGLFAIAAELLVMLLGTSCPQGKDIKWLVWGSGG